MTHNQTPDSYIERLPEDHGLQEEDLCPVCSRIECVCPEERNTEPTREVARRLVSFAQNSFDQHRREIMSSNRSGFEKFVLLHRPYCQEAGCLRPSHKVLNLGNAGLMRAVCWEHDPETIREFTEWDAEVEETQRLWSARRMDEEAHCDGWDDDDSTREEAE